MVPHAPTRYPAWLAPLFLLLNLSLASLLLWPVRALVYTGANDFLSFYAGGRLAFSGDLYQPHAIERAQHEYAGTSSEKLSYIRPPFYAAALAAIAMLPYRTAYLLWQCLQLAAVVALICLAAPGARKGWVFALCASTPLAWSFANGQDLPLLLLLLAVGWKLASAGHDFRAGLVLSLCLFKPHLILLAPLVFVPRGRRRGLVGFLVGALLLFLVSAVIAGPDWLSPYLHLLWTGNIHSGLAGSPNWHGTARGVLGAPWAGWILALLTLGAACAAMRKASWNQAIHIATLGTLLSVPHLFLQDLLLLIPACLDALTAHSERWSRAAAFLLLTPMPYLFQIALPFPSGQILVLLQAALLLGLLARAAGGRAGFPAENQHSSLQK